MKAYCEFGHERTQMFTNHVNYSFDCECGQQLSPQEIDHITPEPYKPSIDPHIRTMQLLLDFEVVGILNGEGKVTIEYDRPSTYE